MPEDQPYNERRSIGWKERAARKAMTSADKATAALRSHVDLAGQNIATLANKVRAIEEWKGNLRGVDGITVNDAMIGYNAPRKDEAQQSDLLLENIGAGVELASLEGNLLSIATVADSDTVTAEINEDGELELTVIPMEGEGVFTDSTGTGIPLLTDSGAVLVGTVTVKSLTALGNAIAIGAGTLGTDPQVQVDWFYNLTPPYSVEFAYLDPVYDLNNTEGEGAIFRGLTVDSNEAVVLSDDGVGNIKFSWEGRNVGASGNVPVYLGKGDTETNGTVAAEFKSLKAGTGITLGTATAGVIEIGNTVTAGNVSVNIGTGESLLIEAAETGYVAGYDAFRSLASNTATGFGGIDVQKSTDELSIWFSAKVANVGSKSEVFKELDPTAGIRLRTLEADATNGGIIVTQEDDTITFEPKLTNLTASGTGIGNIYKELDTTAGGQGIRLRSLKAGTNVTVTENANDITISSSAGGGVDIGSSDGSIGISPAGVSTTPDIIVENVTYDVIETTGATTGDLLRFNGTAWEPYTFDQIALTYCADGVSTTRTFLAVPT